MRPKLILASVFMVLLLALTQGCGRNADNPNVFHDPFASPSSTATKPPTATLTPTGLATATATATGTSSANAPRAVPAGKVILNMTGANHSPQMAYDAQGQLNVFFQTSTAAGGYTYNQAQMKADGSWTTPIGITPEFQFIVNPTPVPDMSARLCILWSGEQYDQSGNSVDGLYRNCEQADGTWQVQSQQLALTSGPSVFSPARASDGSLQSVFVAQKGTAGLYYSPIAAKASIALTGTKLSGSQQVLLGRLAIDSKGGYHAVWVETDGNTAVVVQARDSQDGGKTWSPAQQIYSGSADNPASIGFQMLAGAAGGVHLAWDADNAVHYSHWSAGTGWDKPVQLSGDKRSGGVVLAVNKDGLARAAWSVAASTPTVALGLQAFDGSWAPPSTLSSGRSFETALAVATSGATEAVWNDGAGLRYLEIK